jgi:hypothetical protein
MYFDGDQKSAELKCSITRLNGTNLEDGKIVIGDGIWQHI